MHPRRFARNASHERSCFWRITTQPHPKNSIVAPVVPRLMGSDPGRPVKTHGPPHGPGEAAHTEPTYLGPRPGPAHQIIRGWAAARPGPSKFHRMGRGPTQPTTFFHIVTAWPGPAHQFFESLGPAWPGPSHFQSSRSGLARPVTTFRSARPGSSQLSGRPMTSPGIYILGIYECLR